MDDIRKAAIYGICPNCGAPREVTVTTTTVEGFTRTHQDLICTKGCAEAEQDEWDHDEHYGRTHGP